MSENQRTLDKEVSVTGKGLHTGFDVTVTFKPAPEDHGYVFCRTDLPEKPLIRALAENVTDTQRGTTLEENGASVSTVEHILASFYGMQIDNVLIEMHGPEAPIMGGSSRTFVEAIRKAGRKEQKAERQYYQVREKIAFEDDENGVDLFIYPDDHLSINVLIDYNSQVLGNQYAILDNLGDFAGEISMCRTFVFFHELEFLAKHGKIKGGDLDNAIVILDRLVEQSEIDRVASLFNKPRIKADSAGVLNNVDLHFPNEPARHKLLDMLGDLALIGKPIKGKVVATRPGHYANTRMARLVRQTMFKEQTKNNIPQYYPGQEPLYDVNQIKQLLPHRHPFLLVDKILLLEEESVVGIKNVTFSEDYFSGHFPAEPVMPGVLVVEAMAQTGGILALHKVEDPDKYSTYFLKIDKVKFKRKIVPGDTLVMKLELTDPIRRGIVQMYARTYVGNHLVVEGELTAQIVKNKQ